MLGRSRLQVGLHPSHDNILEYGLASVRYSTDNAGLHRSLPEEVPQCHVPNPLRQHPWLAHDAENRGLPGPSNVIPFGALLNNFLTKKPYQTQHGATLEGPGNNDNSGSIVGVGFPK